MDFTIISYSFGDISHEGRNRIPIYNLKSKLDGRCPACNKKLSATPKTIELRQTIE